MKPLTYLRNELKFSVKEYQALTAKDKEDLRLWAVEEMKVRGIESAE